MIIEMSAVLCATDLQDELEVQDMDYESRTKIKMYYYYNVLQYLKDSS